MRLPFCSRSFFQTAPVNPAVAPLFISPSPVPTAAAKGPSIIMISVLCAVAVLAAASFGGYKLRKRMQQKKLEAALPPAARMGLKILSKELVSAAVAQSRSTCIFASHSDLDLLRTSACTHILTHASDCSRAHDTYRPPLSCRCHFVVWWS